MNARAGIKIPILPNAHSSRSIIAVVRMVETPFHKLGKGNGTSLLNFGENKFLQRFSTASFLFFHTQRSSRLWYPDWTSSQPSFPFSRKTFSTHSTPP